MSHPQNPQNSPVPPQPQPPHQQHPQSPQQWAPQQQTPSPGYPDGPYPPQNHPGYGQKPPKQKKPLLKRWWFWLIVIIVVIAFFGVVSGGGDEASTDSAESNSAGGQQPEGSAEEENADKPAEEAEHGIGDTVAADGWEITVDSVEDGVSKVGDEYLGAQAQGQFVQVAMSVKNTGSDPNYFFEDDIKLGDDEGNTYSADSEAGIYAAEDNILFLEEINPGNTAEGVLVFDVPEDVDPNRLTFAGGLFSDPVEISLK
ncbi:DUF4352 domain-containing protein [Brevibacterium renqingii]|uniref:DUF4352 domain-containing protein n=1 Tax=Brevibacterium renqingii TaxID=2776916 RepID=UPI001ADF59CD|nr:DUF4352 domain-containing protein [Brevibacterium renqingii]